MSKLKSVLATLPLITTACGGSGGSSSSNTITPAEPEASAIDLTQQKGIWSDTETQTFTSASGKQTTTQAPTGIVTSQENMIILMGNSELYVIEKDAVEGHFFTGFSYSTTISPAAELNNSNFIFSFYNPKRDANGEITLPLDGHYDSPIDFNDMAAIWDDDYTTNSTWQYTINNDGSFSASRNGGCTATGTFTKIDITKSELDVSISFNGNCFPLEGTHTGLAWPAEESPGSILNIAVYNGFTSSSKAMGWKLIKQ